MIDIASIANEIDGCGDVSLVAIYSSNQCAIMPPQRYSRLPLKAAGLDQRLR
jgi:hypothetical protein